MKTTPLPNPGFERTAAIAAATLLVLLAGCPRPPAVPTSPRGPAKWIRHHVLACTTSTVDPSGSDVAYQFDWGDNSQSLWSDFIPGGTAFSDTHTWKNADIYHVRARAKNRNGRISEWSDPLVLQVDPNEGEVRWSFGYVPDPTAPEDSADLGGGTFCRGLDGSFYLSAGDAGGLLCRNAYGNRRWEFLDIHEDEMATPAVLSDSSIIVASDGGAVYALNPRGIRKWTVQFSAGTVAPVAVGADNTIFLQTEDDTLYALSPADGTVRWRFHRGGGMVSPVVGTDGTVYACHDDSVFALDPTAGSVKWRHGMRQNISAPAAIDQVVGAIYVADEDGNVVSLGLGDGQPNWEAVVGSYPSAPVIGTDHTVYVCGGGSLHALRAQGGTHWSYRPPLGGLCSAPAVSSDDRIYFLVVTDKKDRLQASDSLYCVRESDGTRRWACGLGSASGSDVVSSPKIDAEGYVYVADDTRGWCVVGSGGPAASVWPLYQHDFENTGRAR